MSLLLLALTGWLGAAVAMLLLWWIAERTRNAGIVDVVWSYGVAACAVFFAWSASGDPGRRALVATLAAIWGLRLGTHLLRRTVGHPEDGRYVELRERWGAKASRNFLVFFQMQASWVVLFALPMLAAASNAAPFPAATDIAGVVVFLVAVVGETIADRQLARFRSDPATRGQVCRRGLWRTSRHPNYFFEWIGWWSYALIAAGGGLWWLAVAGALLMLFFLTRITGIPPTEARALLSRGEAYREYMRTTSAFVPWPPRESTP